MFFNLEIKPARILSLVFNRLKGEIDFWGGEMILENRKIILDERCRRVHKSNFIQGETKTSSPANNQFRNQSAREKPNSSLLTLGFQLGGP